MFFTPLLLALGVLGTDAKPHRPISKNHLRHAIAQRAPTELMHSHTKRFSGSGTFYDTTENLSACGELPCGPQSPKLGWVRHDLRS